MCQGCQIKNNGSAFRLFLIYFFIFQYLIYILVRLELNVAHGGLAEIGFIVGFRFVAKIPFDILVRFCED